MRLTRRGVGVLVVAALALGLGVSYGARSLDAVLVPSLVALAIGVVQVLRRRRPVVRRSRPVPGFPGETRRVSVAVESNLPCDVGESTEEGLRAIDPDARLAGDGSYEYEVELLERGEHALGPATVRQRDTLGLVYHTTAVRETTPMLVYPRVEPIADRTAFAGLVERAGTQDRDAFDRLREYSSGDSLRDINWKASAKRPIEEFVVTEFAAQDEGGISIVAESEVGHADEMASAAASIAGYLLDADLLVDVVAPGGEVEEGRGEEHRTRILELLARTGAGRIDGSRGDRADVHVFADEDGTTVRIRETRHRFESLVGTDDSAVGPAGTGIHEEVIA
ncbi:DUF58 domain-containing protein [Salinirubellus sp. GCM10025818]|uniref:DUF58 domain-containing protein n=1 Tax=Salinirubellus TaxID=2162630 RepID=UPI0030D10662